MSDNKGTFDMLNDALFAQMDKLQSIDPANREQMEQTIEQSRAVSQLAGNIISNANTAISLLKYQAMDGMDMDGLAATTPKMLTGHYR